VSAHVSFFQALKFNAERDFCLPVMREKPKLSFVSYLYYYDSLLSVSRVPSSCCSVQQFIYNGKWFIRFHSCNWWFVFKVILFAKDNIIPAFLAMKKGIAIRQCHSWVWCIDNTNMDYYKRVLWKKKQVMSCSVPMQETLH